MTKLLVSVRSAEEAAAALAGGAALIDVKEPLRGSLGCADSDTIAAVRSAVAGRCPISAAFGELDERCAVSLPLAFAKWGLAGCGRRRSWPDELRRAAAQLSDGCRPVALAYADWQRAAAPAPAEVCDFACKHRWGAFLIDTCRKDGTTLLDWLSSESTRALVCRCRAEGIPVALAGSLGAEQMRRLRDLEPDWFAVRGAACVGSRRTQSIDTGRVRRLVELLAAPVTGAIPAG
jgi:uncharacterized protein (UPF0264 family)